MGGKPKPPTSLTTVSVKDTPYRQPWFQARLGKGSKERS